MTKGSIKYNSVQLYASVTAKKPRLTIYRNDPNTGEPNLYSPEVLTVAGKPISWQGETYIPVTLSDNGLRYATTVAKSANLKGKTLGAYYQAWMQKKNPVVYVKASQVDLYETPQKPEKKSNNTLWLGIAAIGLALILKSKKNVQSNS